MTFKRALEIGIHILTEARIENAEGDAFSLLEKSCNIDRTFYYCHQNDKLTYEQKVQYRIYLSKRAEHIPLQYIIGTQEFMGMSFKVNSSVLIPRQDTEVLVEEVMKLLEPNMDVLDMCTGSGCIISALKFNYPSIHAVASDISRAAIGVAKENAKTYGLDIDFIRSNLFDRVRGVFDIIVSNPPYIRTDVIETLDREVCAFEPFEALDGMEDGLYFYREIAKSSKNHLKIKGYLCLEIGYDQGEEVSDLLFAEGFSPVHVIKDLAGLDRVIIAKYSGES